MSILLVKINVDKFFWSLFRNKFKLGILWLVERLLY